MMTFEYKPEVFNDGSMNKFWFSGIYKIVQYEALSRINRPSQPYFAAYFKPKGWKNWGNRVQVETDYDTFEEACRACEKHAHQFNEPLEDQRLPKYA